MWHTILEGTGGSVSRVKVKTKTSDARNYPNGSEAILILGEQQSGKKKQEIKELKSTY